MVIIYTNIMVPFYVDAVLDFVTYYGKNICV